jgi:hypothetical protein
VVAVSLKNSSALEEANTVLEDAKKHIVRFERNEEKIQESKDVTADRDQLAEAAAVVQGRTYPLDLLNLLAGVLPRGNETVVDLNDEQRKVLEQQGLKQHLVDGVADELRRAQGELNADKVWVVGFDLTADRTHAKAVITVARPLVRDETGRPDQAATLKSLEEGLLRDIRGVLPDADFEGIPVTIFSLVAGDTKPPTGGLFGGSSFTEYLSQQIVVVHPQGAGGDAEAEEQTEEDR